MTDYSKITDQQIMDTLRAVVAERPDFVYAAPEGSEGSACYYVHGAGENAQPGCVVGVVLHRLGVPLDTLSAYETKPAHRVMGSLGIGSWAVRDALRAGQNVQDGSQDPCVREDAEAGKRALPTWSDALAAAERFLTDYS